MLRFLTENAFSRLHGSVLPTAGINHVVFPGKYLGRTRGVQKCGATPHGSKLSRGALLLALQQSHHHDAGAIVLKHELAGALDEVEEVLGDGYDLHRLRPLHTKRGPHRCRPLQVGDILHLAAPRRPRRLNVLVSRTLKAAASGK